MLVEEINLLDELNNLSKIHFLDREDIDHIMLDMAKPVVLALRIERINVWLFNTEKTALVSIGEYDRRTDVFKRDSVLKKKDFPTYFNALYENEIIHAPDIYNHPITKEFNEVYSRPNGIWSLLDIPIRMNGELIGVICYEKTDTPKTFTQNEKSFCLSVSFVLASNLEARHRRAAQTKLEKSLEENELLLTEVNHRVKNNLSILISLMRLSKDRAKTKEFKLFLEEYEQRIFSMLKIHDLLNEKNKFSEINLTDYLKELVVEFKETYPQIQGHINESIEKLDYLIPTKDAIHIGLIVSEIVLDSIKYASTKASDYKFAIEIRKNKKGKVELRIGDNGNGFDFLLESNKETMGLPLIKDLIESLAVKVSYPTMGNCYYSLEFNGTKEN